MRVLFICRYYPPENKIGAIRPSRIARYLHKNSGADVDVLTVEPIEGFDSNVQLNYDGIQVYRVKPSTILLKLNRALKGTSNQAVSNEKDRKPAHTQIKKKEAAKRIIRNGLFQIREYMLERSYIYRAKRIVRHINIQYDAVVSTYSTKFSHIIAMTYKKLHPEVKWIADYRDALWGTDSTEKQKKQGSSFVKKISARCDAVTIVSEGIKDIHSCDFGTVPVYIVPNGYDQEDISVLSFKKTKSSMSIQIAYTGELYNGKRDLTPLFRAINHLCSEKSITYDDIEIIYAGKSADVFRKQASQYADIHYQVKGFLPRNEALSVQADADILLLASWCEPNEKSILTGKFFEYLQMDKPIVCIISGSASGCELSNIIRNHNLGCSYEMASHDDDFQTLCDFLKDCVLEKSNCGMVSYHPDIEFIRQYDYQNIASQFYELLRNI